MHNHGGEIYSHHYKLDYSVNVNCMGTPASVIEAAAKGAALSAQYPDVNCGELRSALAEFQQVKESQIVFGNGAADVIFSSILARKPGKVLVPAPTFAEYEQAAKVVGAQMVYYILKEENEFRLDEGFLDALTPDIDMAFLCNPNNPTGQLVEKKELFRILDRCAENDIFLVVDECFNEFVEEPEKYSLIKHLEQYDNLLILKAFTKTYAMAGLRLGYGLCSDQDFMAKMAECNQPWAVSIPAQFAGVAALKETEYVAQSMSILREERIFLKAELLRLGFRVFDSQANYIFFKAAADLKEACGKRDILIRDCRNYVGLAPGYFRVCVKRHEENLELVRVLEEIVNG
ncbi:MAG: pyridoxal phosphate-dependent class II aminotransferase [Lachnospiraceae bacterium]|nr:pyridoxal phosphate-dependent class II aminotransferase [Lachnospiraceae bacterium]